MDTWVLINLDTLTILKITDSENKAKAWAIVLGLQNYRVLSITPRKAWAQFSHADIIKIFHNLCGGQLTEAVSYHLCLFTLEEEIGFCEKDLTEVQDIFPAGADIPPELLMVKAAVPKPVRKPAPAGIEKAPSKISRSGGGATAKVHEILDAAYAEAGKLLPRKELQERCEAHGIHPGTFGVQYSKWKKHHNL